MSGPIGQRTVRLGDAYDDLDERLDDLAAQLQDVDGGTQSGQALHSLANETQQQLSGVAHLVNEYGADATVTVQGLGAGPYARMDDRVADHRADRDGSGDAPGGRRNIFAASGLLDAPFADIPDNDDPDVTAKQRFDAALEALSDDSLPVGVVKWIEALVSEESSVEGNFKPLRERLVDSSAD